MSQIFFKFCNLSSPPNIFSNLLSIKSSLLKIFYLQILVSVSCFLACNYIWSFFTTWLFFVLCTTNVLPLLPEFPYLWSRASLTPTTKLYVLQPLYFALRCFPSFICRAGSDSNCKWFWRDWNSDYCGYFEASKSGCCGCFSWKIHTDCGISRHKNYCW